MKGSRRFAAVILALVLTIVVGCAAQPSQQGGPTDQAPKGGRLLIARSGDSDSLDPAHTIASISWQVFSQIYDTLVSRDSKGQFVGVIAERWEIANDGKAYTFHLRKGLKFHDGTPLNAEAVKFTFDRLIDPATKAPSASWIAALEKVTVVDDSTVTMTLKEPFSPLLGNISIAYFGIVSPAAVKKYGDDYGKNPVGSGPFMFKSWVPGESITLVRNPDYKNFRPWVKNPGAPNLTEVVFRNIPEEQTQMAALESGEVHLLTLPPNQLKRTKADDRFNVFVSEESTGISYLEFTMDSVAKGKFGASFRAPFDDIKLRQAVGYAVDADLIIEQVLNGLAVRNYGPMPSGNLGYTPDMKKYGMSYDPKKAEALLDEAGWTKGADGVRRKGGKELDILFWTWNATTQRRVAEVIQNQLTQVGFKIKLETMEVATLLAKLKDGTPNMDLMGWGWSEADILYMFTDTDSGIGWYRPESYRTLVSKARVQTDPKERAVTYQDAMKVMLADAAMVPLWSATSITATRADVKDFELGPQGFWTLQDAYVVAGK